MSKHLLTSIACWPNTHTYTDAADTVTHIRRYSTASLFLCIPSYIILSLSCLLPMHSVSMLALHSHSTCCFQWAFHVCDRFRIQRIPALNECVQSNPHSACIPISKIQCVIGLSNSIQCTPTKFLSGLSNLIQCIPMKLLSFFDRASKWQFNLII